LLPSGPIGAVINDLLTVVLVQRNVEYFVTGMMLYLCWKHGVTTMRLAVIAFALIVTPLDSTWLATTAHVGFVVLVGLTTMGILTPLRSRPVIFLGYISYTLYLLHQYIGYVVIHEAEARGMNSNLAILCASAVAIGLATALTICVERPAMAFFKAQYKALRTNRPLGAAISPDSVASS
jgi:peptidoglycan/LPS O-acetylase OafA/YrhL